MEQPVITIYSTPTCSFCHLAKQYLTDAGIAYTDVDVSGDPARQQEMITKSGQLGVPVIDINGTIVVGFDKPKIDMLLGLGQKTA